MYLDRNPGEPGINSQELFYEEAYEAIKEAGLSEET